MCDPTRTYRQIDGVILEILQRPQKRQPVAVFRVPPPKRSINGMNPVKMTYMGLSM